MGKAWDSKFANFKTKYNEPLASYGAGIRLPLGFIVLRWDFGKKVEFSPELRNRLSRLTQLTQGFFEEIRSIRTARIVTEERLPIR